jgi:hypothetical protein
VLLHTPPHPRRDLLRPPQILLQRLVQLPHQEADVAGVLDVLQPQVDRRVAAPPIAGAPRGLAPEGSDLVLDHGLEPAAEPAAGVVDERRPHGRDQLGQHRRADFLGLVLAQPVPAAPAVDQRLVALQEGPPGGLVVVRVHQLAQEGRAGRDALVGGHGDTPGARGGRTTAWTCLRSARPATGDTLSAVKSNADCLPVTAPRVQNFPEFSEMPRSATLPARPRSVQ